MNDRGDGGGEASGDGNDFVSGADALVGGEFVGGEGRKSYEISTGTRIHEERVFYSKEGGKFAFHRFTFWAECEPEIKCG